MKKATLTILVVLSVLIGLFTQKWWVSIILIILTAIWAILKSFRTIKNGSYKLDFDSQNSKDIKEKRNIEEIKDEEEALFKLESMTETDCLIWFGTNIDLDLSNLDPKHEFLIKEYRDLFGGYIDVVDMSKIKTKNIENRHSPIDPIFEELLKNEDTTCINRDVRIFKMKERNIGHSPIYYFGSFEKDPFLMSMSAKNIIDCFILAISSDKISERNWFLLNTKHPEVSTSNKDIQMVDIRFFDKTGKFLLYCYPYQRWSSMGGWIGTESIFFIPNLSKDKMLEKILMSRSSF
jgi:hypothetical protein